MPFPKSTEWLTINKYPTDKITQTTLQNTNIPFQPLLPIPTTPCNHPSHPITRKPSSDQNSPLNPSYYSNIPPGRTIPPTPTYPKEGMQKSSPSPLRKQV